MSGLIFNLKKVVKRNAVITKQVRRVLEALWARDKRKAARYINKTYAHLYEKYNNFAPSLAPLETNWKYPVWVCWFQGKDNMPEMIKICYDSLLRNANGHDVILLTLDNYAEYTDIPERVCEKYRRGIISHTHFSELLRVSLLSRRGGLWIDATVYVSGALPTFEGLSLWTGRWNHGRWFAPVKQCTEFLAYCRPNSVMWNFLREVFYDYWERNNKLISYHILEVAIRCAYANITPVKNMMDNVPITRQGVFDLYVLMNAEYDDDVFRSLCDEVCFHKLTHKEDFRRRTKEGTLTFCGHLCQEYEKIIALKN